MRKKIDCFIFVEIEISKKTIKNIKKLIEIIIKFHFKFIKLL